MERLYSRQKTYSNSNRFTLKSLLTIPLRIADLFTIPELKAQDLILINTASLSSSLRELINYTNHNANTGIVATTNTETTNYLPNPYKILTDTTYCNILNFRIGERPIKSYVSINQLNNS